MGLDKTDYRDRKIRRKLMLTKVGIEDVPECITALLRQERQMAYCLDGG